MKNTLMTCTLHPFRPHKKSTFCSSQTLWRRFDQNGSAGVSLYRIYARHYASWGLYIRSQIMDIEINTPVCFDADGL